MRSASPALRPRQVLRRATVLAVPLLLCGLLLPAAAPAARAATCGPMNLTVNQPATAPSTGCASFPASAPWAAAATTLVWTNSPPPGS